MSHQCRQTSIQNLCHPLTTIQNSYHAALMGYSTDPRSRMKSACCEKRLNFWQIACATLSLYRVLPGVRETRSPLLRHSLKSGLSTAFNDSASIPMARKSYKTCLSLP